ncbi:MAG: secretion protein HlyD [Robiginitomaculum sp.]|nr:MAG: secretion protein HlyD [Robiginitomaculum sp.]
MKMMKRTPLLVLAGVVALALLAWWGLRGKTDNAGGRYDIETASVGRGDVARIVAASGAVRALTTVEVGSQLSGQVVELYADFNSQVKAGQLVARIDPQTFETRVQQAKADLLSASANVAVQVAGIARAMATLEQAKKDYQRQEQLLKEDAISQALFDSTERALAVAKADVALAKAQHQSALASKTQREAALETANVDFERTYIRSPIDGVVIERSIDVGQTVAASFSAPVLFRIAQDLGDIRIDAAVVEADIGGITEGDKVVFTVDAYPDDQFSGEVEQVRLVATELQNVVTYTVVIAAQNSQMKLLPGMTANVEITADKREKVLRIASGALRFSPPKNGPPVAEARAGGNANGGGNRRGGDFARQFADLGVSAEAQKAIGTDMRKEMQAFAKLAQSPAAQFNRNGMRQRRRAIIERVLKRHLSGEQYDAYVQQQKRRANVKRVQVWQQNEDGALVPRMVVLGLDDGENVEILRGVKEGDAFITRLRIKSDGKS